MERPELERRVSADPSDTDAVLALIARRARDEGPAVYLEPLTVLARWRAASETEQDWAIAAVARALGEAFEPLGAELFYCEEEENRLAVFRHAESGAEMVLLPAGSFAERSYDQYGRLELGHQGSVARPFLIGRYPLRQEEWDAIGGPDVRRWSGGDLPIEGCSWRAAADWLRRAGDGLRLPRGDEWEYAARGGTETRYFWADFMEGDYCWFEDNADEQTREVTEHDDLANAFGLVDPLGNVYEWCADRRGGQRMLRGGSWASEAESCAAGFVRWEAPDEWTPTFGLRLARGLDELFESGGAP